MPVVPFSARPTQAPQQEKPSDMAVLLAAATMDQLGRFDAYRPQIENPDGSISTEKTIGIEADGKHYNIPTIVDGKERSHEEAVQLWKDGKNKEVGVFDSKEEADSTAPKRSNEIGKRRGF